MKRKFPKIAKLVTDGGFSRTIKLDRPVIRIAIPLTQKLRFNAPELNYEAQVCFEAIFTLEKVYKRYALYKQIDTIQKIK